MNRDRIFYAEDDNGILRRWFPPTDETIRGAVEDAVELAANAAYKAAVDEACKSRIGLGGAGCFDKCKDCCDVGDAVRKAVLAGLKGKPAPTPPEGARQSDQRRT